MLKKAKQYRRKMRISKQIVFLLFLSVLIPSAWAEKISITLANSLDEGKFDSVEFSFSSGGNYATSLDIGGTYYFNQKSDRESFQLLSFDIFSSLEAIYEYNVLFAAGIRFFGVSADLTPAAESNNFSYGLMPGIDVGYRFSTPIPTVLLFSMDFAPDIITGGDVDGMFIANLLYEIMFTPIVIGHVSYRYGESQFPYPDIPRATKKFENSIGLGLKIRF